MFKVTLTAKQIENLGQWHSSMSDPIYAVSSSALSFFMRSGQRRQVTFGVSSQYLEALEDLVAEIEEGNDDGEGDEDDLRFAWSLMRSTEEARERSYRRGSRSAPRWEIG